MRAFTARKSSRAGFTLFEVMVASAMTVIAVVSIYTSMMMFQNMIYSARCHNEAETMAMDQIWSVFNQSYAALQNFNPNPLVITVPQSSSLFNSGGTMRTAVMVYSNGCNISVAVDWIQPSFGFGQGSRPLQTLLSIRRANTLR